MNSVKKSKLTYIIVLAFILRLINLNQSFWLDEAAQVIESARPFLKQFDIAADFHPPGFHLLLYSWMKISHTEIWIRLLPVLFGIGAVFLVYKIARSLKFQHPYIAAFLLAISPFHIWYSQEARPYSMFVFTALLSTYVLLEKRWSWYILSVIALLYSLYFAPFLLLGHIIYVCLFDRSNLNKLTKSLALAALAFLPWVPSFLQQLSIGTGGFFKGWTNIVSVAPIKAVPLTFAKFIFGKGSIDPNAAYAIALLPMMLAFLVSLTKSVSLRSGKIVIILFVIPFAAAVIVSFFVPVIAPQRMIFLLPFFLLILAIGTEKLSPPYRTTVLGVVMLTSILGLIQYYTDARVQREQWKQAVHTIEKDGYNAAALFAFPEPFAPYLWYSAGRVPGFGYATTFRATQEDFVGIAPQISGRQRVYLFQYLAELTDPEQKARRFLMYAGYSQSEIKNFPGVGFIYVYDK